MINESKFFHDHPPPPDKLLEVFYMKNKNSFLKFGHICIDLQGRGRSCIPHTKVSAKLYVL